MPVESSWCAAAAKEGVRGRAEEPGAADHGDRKIMFC
jgi:hypothetical protein